jgi:hypothetical protein
MLIAGLAIALLIGIVSAWTISYFGQIQMTATVKQAVLLDGKDIREMPITDSLDAAGGEIVCKFHWLESQTSVPVNLALVTDITYDGGITVTYWKILGYKFDEVIDWARVTVEDKGEAVEWTIDLDENSPNLDGNPVAGVGVVIGIGNEIKFQVHNNDGVDTGYPYGTWLYSIYDNGWHTGTGGNNQPLPAGITATGARDRKDNPQMIFTIAISKKYLDMWEFKWAVFFKGGMQHGSTKYPSAFSWSDTTTVNMATATLLEQITSSFTLAPGERLDFIICYEFAVDIYPGIYTITTEVVPVS